MKEPARHVARPASNHHFRTIWISDLHLGTRDSQTEYLLDFLAHNTADQLYLVGDIVDGWALQRSWYWDEKHDAVIAEILRLARSGTRVTYIPGNHDEFARKYVGVSIAHVDVAMQCMHRLADGRKLLVVHGDQFDGIIIHAKWLSVFGSSAYRVALTANRWFNALRKRMGLPYWSLSAYLKQKTKRAVQHIADFEEVVAETAREFGADGVLCGHIHCPEMRDVDGILYCNSGDWVESCTAIVEKFDGELDVVQWQAPGSGHARSVDDERAGILSFSGALMKSLIPGIHREKIPV